MALKLLEIGLFGACIVRSTEPGAFDVSGGKHQALFALLATAPYGKRTRVFLQEALWGTTSYEGGRQNLRRALSDLRKIIGNDFNKIIQTNNAEVTLDLNAVRFIGEPMQAVFLEGLELPEVGFQQWLSGIRANPEQIQPLYNSAGKTPTKIKPLVTVLPFPVVFGDERKAVIGDWMAEEVCRTLSRSNLLSVISHLSSRMLTAQRVDLAALNASLNIDYCVSGSLRVAEDMVIVDCDFIDTATGHILWTRQFRGRLQDFMGASQAGIEEIARAVGRAIADDSLSYVARQELADLDDKRLLIAGVSLMHRSGLSAFARARPLIEEAVARAPASAAARGWLAKWHLLAVHNGWSDKPERDTMIAQDNAARALDIDPEDAFSLTMDGVIHNNLLRRPDIADRRYLQALDRNPNEALAWLMKGTQAAFRDDGAAAVEFVQEARRLSPVDPFGYFYDSMSASAYLADGNYAKALELADRSLAWNERHTSTLRVKIVALDRLGRTPEATASAGDLQRRQPNFTVRAYLETHPAADYEIGRRMAESLLRAGIRDT